MICNNVRNVPIATSTTHKAPPPKKKKKKEEENQGKVNQETQGKRRMTLHARSLHNPPLPYLLQHGRSWTGRATRQRYSTFFWLKWFLNDGAS